MNGAEVVQSLAATTAGTVVRETHGSWVVLTATRAWKVKKPVRWSFLDYSTLDARRAACREEVRVNASLAPDIYLGVRPVLDRDGIAILGVAGDEASAVEYVVEMRRFDERDTMAARLADDRLGEQDVHTAAARIAAFHADATPCAPHEPVSALRSRITSDLDDLDTIQIPGETKAARRFAGGLLARHGPLITARADQGLIRDGHGDLRADHLVLGDAPAIVDRLEFDSALRCADVADDLAFLTMDLESRGARWAAELMLSAYAAAGGHPAPAGLAAGFAWRRAIVRVKTALLTGDERRAADLRALAERLAWRARAPQTIVVCGPPASGKSTLARAVAERMEMTVLSSDRLRKELLDLRPTDRADESAYSAEFSRRVYAELTRRAASARDGGVIIDANYGRREDRTRLLRALGTGVRWVWCDPPATVRMANAATRMNDPARESDATPTVVIALATAFEPLDELPGAAVLHLRAQRPLPAFLQRLAGWLDSPGEQLHQLDT